jgi:DNA-directed RNA polymerase specialized sigma24 family protein
MTEQGFDQDRQISEIVAEERSRLRNFIRRRVLDPADAEDILQEVFYKLVDANRLLTTCVKSFREVRIEGRDRNRTEE